MNLNEKVSGTNHDEVSRLQTPSPQFRSTPLPPNFHKNYYKFGIKLLQNLSCASDC